MSPSDRARLSSFLAVLACCAAWEFAAPKRLRSAPRLWRWANNLGLLGLDALALRALIPVLASDMARLAEERRWGLLHRLDAPFAVKFAAAFLLLDLAIYAQHWTFHAVPWLWSVHKVHHTDIDLDATSGVRFHPLEILLSMLVKLAAVAAIGAHFLAVIVFEIALNATSLFNHANVRIPARLERLLRLFVVTPDMHRVHHSVRPAETNSNFGFNLPWWDRLLGTYDPEPADGHQLMILGLPEHRDWKAQHLGWLLSLPFR